MDWNVHADMIHNFCHTPMFLHVDQSATVSSSLERTSVVSLSLSQRYTQDTLCSLLDGANADDAPYL